MFIVFRFTDFLSEKNQFICGVKRRPYFISSERSERERSSRAQKINRYIFIDLAVILRINTRIYPQICLFLSIFTRFCVYFALFLYETTPLP